VSAPTGYTPGPWKQGFPPRQNWVSVPGLVKGINAGSAANAARIVYAVNNIDARESRIAALEIALRDCLEHMEHSTPQGRVAYEAADAMLRAREVQS
jgi:hypothetical protein